jgi:hypothetical protein
VTANRDEIDCAEVPVEMRRVMQPFTYDTRHYAIISLVEIRMLAQFSRTQAIEVNRPYLQSSRFQYPRPLADLVNSFLELG